MILGALTLDVNSGFLKNNLFSSPQQSAVFCHLLVSYFVAEANQTVIDVQKTMMAEENCFNCSSGRFNFFSCRRKYNLCWAIFGTAVSHFRSQKIIDPRNLNIFSAATVLSMIYSTFTFTALLFCRRV